jgi:hypothetical protein
MRNVCSGPHAREWCCISSCSAQRIVADEGNARIEERQRLWCAGQVYVDVIQRRGEVLSTGRVKQPGSGFVVPERVAFGVVLLPKASAGSGQCGWSRRMSYTTLQRN